MSAENDAGARRHLAQFLDENGTGAAQFVDNVAVMDDLLAHINGGAVKIEHNFHDVDRAHHAGAKASRPQEDDLLRGNVSASRLGVSEDVHV